MNIIEIANKNAEWDAQDKEYEPDHQPSTEDFAATTSTIDPPQTRYHRVQQLISLVRAPRYLCIEGRLRVAVGLWMVHCPQPLQVVCQPQVR